MKPIYLKQVENTWLFGIQTNMILQLVVKVVYCFEILGECAFNNLTKRSYGWIYKNTKRAKVLALF